MFSQKKKIIQVCVATTHALILVEGGQLYSVGTNSVGQILPKYCENRLVPRLISQKILKNRKVKQIAINNYTTFILTEDNIMYEWGIKYCRSFDSWEYSRPWMLKKSYYNVNEENKITSIESKYHNVCVKREDGAMHIGEFPFENTNDKFCEEKILKFCVGKSYLLVLSNKGNVYSMESNAHGQSDVENKFLVCEFNQMRKEYFNHEQIKDIAVGESHSLAVTETGKVYSWGLNHKGQLGTGDFEYRKYPCLIESSHFNNENVTNVECGDMYSFILTLSGKVYSFGENNQGQLGLGHATRTLVPTQISPQYFNFEKVTSVYGGTNNSAFDHSHGNSFCVTQRGRLFTWGFERELSSGEYECVTTPQPCGEDLFG